MALSVSYEVADELQHEFIYEMITADETLSEQDKRWLHNSLTEERNQELVSMLTHEEKENLAILKSSFLKKIIVHEAELVKKFFESIASGIEQFEKLRKHPYCIIPHYDILEACLQSPHTEILNIYVGLKMSHNSFIGLSIDRVIERLFSDTPTHDKWDMNTLAANYEKMIEIISVFVEIKANILEIRRNHIKSKNIGNRTIN